MGTAEVVDARVEAGSLRSMGDAGCRAGGGWKASVPWASLVSPPRDGGGRGFVRKWGSVAVTGELGKTPLRISNTEEER